MKTFTHVAWNGGHSFRCVGLFVLMAVGCGPYSITSRTGAYKNADEAAARQMGECPNGLIEDAEDNNPQINKTEGRGGYWFTFADTEGTTVSPKGEFLMAAGGAEGSAYAARMTGKVAGSGEALYVGMGFKLSEAETPYDASRYKGVRFWAKAHDEYAVVRFKTPDVNTEPSGGRCEDCYNDFGMDIALTPKWTQYTVPFELMKQQNGWGDSAPAVAKDALFAIQWQFSKPNTEFDVWIDNVAFVGCE